MSERYSQPFSKKVWSAQPVSANGVSDFFDSHASPFVTAGGNSSVATTITLLFSFDGQTYYAGPTLALTGAGDFYLSATMGAQFYKLQSSQAATITAWIGAK